MHDCSSGRTLTRPCEDQELGAKSENLDVECGPTPQQRSERSEDGQEGRERKLTQGGENSDHFDTDEDFGKHNPHAPRRASVPAKPDTFCPLVTLAGPG